MTRPSEEQVYAFVYGALMADPRVQRSARPAQIGDWAVRFCVRGAPGFEPSFAGLVREPGNVAHGVVAALTASEWRQLAKAEIHYDRVPLTAMTPDGAVDCLGLAVKETRMIPERPPSARYARLLLEGAMAAGLPDEVVARYRELARTGSKLSSCFGWLFPVIRRLVPYVGGVPALILVMTGLLAATSALLLVLASTLTSC